MNPDSSSPQKQTEARLKHLRKKFQHFKTLLDLNHQVLKAISEIEAQVRSKKPVDISAAFSSILKIRRGVEGIVKSIYALGGEKYSILQEIANGIFQKIENMLPTDTKIKEDQYTIHFNHLTKDRTWSVGGKNAHLGEIKGGIGMPVPRGFAITAWAYKRFLDYNGMQERISKRISGLNIQSYEDLLRFSERIQSIVLAGSIPSDLREAIERCLDCIENEAPVKGYSLRSSAIGEDSHFSFAGQYKTYLNVRRGDVLEKYRRVVAGKFAPKAIYYLLSHSLRESDLAMSVGCMEMVDAICSGVIYTKNPINPADKCMVISSIWGLGGYLVNGVLTPDEVRYCHEERQIHTVHVVKKLKQLGLGQYGETIKTAVPLHLQKKLSVTESQIMELADYAMTIENFYGTPQDIEWAVDRSGEVKILQTRPLQLLKQQVVEPDPIVINDEPLFEGGETVCPGAGYGKVYFVHSPNDLIDVPENAVLVAPHSFPGLVTVMERVSALLTETGGMASHMAVLAREYRLPTISGLGKIANLLSTQAEVTVDATDLKIYRGARKDLVERRKLESDVNDVSFAHQMLNNLLQYITPLNLINPDSVEFRAENCKTIHDITRFAHQQAMMEMFHSAQNTKAIGINTHKLSTSIPLNVEVVCLNEFNSAPFNSNILIDEKKIPSQPMQALWNGILNEGWPSTGAPSKEAMKKFSTIESKRSGEDEQRVFEESSYVVLAEDYVVLSLRLGYHFTAIEAMCTNEVSKNFIRMQHKGGGASLERRTNRVKLLETILGRMGFRSSGKLDFLDALLTYDDKDQILQKLYTIGRLTMRTKQLDMALSNDSMTEWWTGELMRILGINK